MKPITAYYAHKFNPLYHVVHATSYSGCRILFFGLVAGVSYTILTLGSHGYVYEQKNQPLTSTERSQM